MLVIIRLTGLIALFWTNWPMAAIGFSLIATINSDDFEGRAILIKNTTARMVVEFITSIMAIVGIWFFPLIPAIYAHIAAVLAGVATFCVIASALTGSLRE